MTKKITAAELMSQLAADPKWVAARAREDAERSARTAELQRAEAPLVDELRGAGVKVGSVWDLVNTPGSYPAAVPILLAHLSRPYPPAVREGIGRALAVPETKNAGWDLLLKMYREEPHGRAKDGIGVAIAATADDDVLTDVLAMIRDPRHGSSRLFFLRTLERSADPRARAALMELGTDPELAAEIQVILRRTAKRRRRKAKR